MHRGAVPQSKRARRGRTPLNATQVIRGSAGRVGGIRGSGHESV